MTVPNDARAGRIYVLIDPRDDQVKYVGKTVWTLERRLKGHIAHALRDARARSHCSNWIRKLDTLGLQPKIKLIEEVPAGLNLLNEAEKKWIAVYRGRDAKLCNQTDGGDGGATTAGRKLTQAQKDAVSRANSKASNPERARKLSEHKKKQWQDPEYRERMLLHMKMMTEKSRAKNRGDAND